MRTHRSAVCLVLAASIATAGCKSKATNGVAPIASGPTTTTGPEDSGSPAPSTTPPPQEVPGTSCRGDTPSTFTPQTNVPAPPALSLPNGFALEVLATIGGARHLVALPNGDLLVGTSGDTVYLVPGAEADGPSGAPVPFAKMPESHAHGVSFSVTSCTAYVTTSQGIYAMPYVDGQKQATPGSPIAKVRPDGPTGHITTSSVFTQGTLYASVGSSCNACVETDPTRATVLTLAPDGSKMATRARRIRNAIALAINPETGSVWAGGAGQDDLPSGHPYEFFDPVTLHPGVADYGWPDCEENRIAYKSGADCSQVVVPRVVMPAYATIIGAAFYPSAQTGTFTFPSNYRGLFMAAHGSWHDAAGKYAAAPRIVFVAMNGDSPVIPVDWTNPNKQLTEFVGGLEMADGTTRVGRPTGLAVGRRGSLFFADDLMGVVYRVRPR